LQSTARRASIEAMDVRGTSDGPCYAARMLAPFFGVLRDWPGFPREWLAFFDETDPDERVPVAVAHRMLDAAVRLTEDGDLGLKAAHRLALGDAGALDYLLVSGARVEDAIALSSRYMRLVNDALRIELETVDERAVLRMDSTVVLPRAAMDFQSAAFFRNHCRAWLDGAVGELIVVFSHPEPESSLEYVRTFAPAKLEFGASFQGFVFPRSHLQNRLPAADSRLLQVIQKHALRLMLELPKSKSFTERVRATIAEELRGGRPSAPHVAARMGLGARTLGRRLESEGTTFSALLDELRRRLALSYVADQEIGLCEVGLLLGFSHTAAFHRAFRRWTGHTPLEYRRASVLAQRAG
jgi:AraC-like DNA-binding protein